MFLADVTVPGANGSGRFHLYPVGDLHADRIAFQEDRFKRYRQAIIDDPQSLAVFVGDAVEGRTPGQKHFNTATIRPDYLNNLESYCKHALEHVTRLLKPITDAGRPLVILEGNHDAYMQWTGFSAMLADRCNATYLGGEGMLRVRAGHAKSAYTTTVYCTHGSGGGRQPGGKVNSLVALRGVATADIYLAGHVHDAHDRVVSYPTVPRKGKLALEWEPVAFLRAPAFTVRAVEGIVGYEGKHAYGATDQRLKYLAWNPFHRTADTYPALNEPLAA
jgi:hypothetical protein